MKLFKVIAVITLLSYNPTVFAKSKTAHNPGHSKIAHMKVTHKLIGIGSFYAKKFNGRKTASGDVYSQNKLTAAHRTIPLGKHVLVTNLETGQAVKVLINDRGPYVKGRIIDLSKKAAIVIQMAGISKVSLNVLD